MLLDSNLIHIHNNNNGMIVSKPQQLGNLQPCGGGRQAHLHVHEYSKRNS